MQFKDIYTLALSRADEIPGDTIIDSIVKSGCNQGYSLLAMYKDKQIKKQSITYADLMTLPVDFMALDRILVSGIKLDDNDYTVNGSLMITNTKYKTGSVDLYYISSPTALSADTDAPIIREYLHPFIATYGAYSVQLYKKKYNAANELLQEFMSIINDINGGDKK